MVCYGKGLGVWGTRVAMAMLCNYITRVALSVVARYRRYEASKGLVSQSLSSKLTCEREMAHKAQNAFKRALSRERSAHKALELLLTAVLACFNGVKHCFSMF